MWRKWLRHIFDEIRDIWKYEDTSCVQSKTKANAVKKHRNISTFITDIKYVTTATVIISFVSERNEYKTV